MEHKSHLVLFTLLIGVIVISINWYTGLNSYYLEEDFTNETVYSYSEALEVGKETGMDINPNRKYLKKERLIINHTKSLVPMVFNKDTIFREVGYFSRSK